MSMILLLVTLSDANIARIIENPPLVWHIFSPGDPEVCQNATPQSSRSGTAQQPVPDLEMQAGEGECSDLDKAWHGIHYLLNQSIEERDVPLSFLVSGGRQIGDFDVGYGPARAFGAEEVRTIDMALSSVDDATLRSRFDLDKMIQQGVYPLLRDSAYAETLEYLISYAAVLRVAVRQAAEYRLGMVLAIV